MPAPYRPNPANASWNDSLQRLSLLFGKWNVGNFSWACPMSNSPSRGRYHWSSVSGPKDDVGVTVTFRHGDGPERSITVNKFGTPRDNLWALAKGLDEIRLNEQRGLDDVARAFYLMLPAPVVQRDPWEVLGVRPDASPLVIDIVYKGLAKTHHPDSGGDVEKFKEIQTAYEQVKAGQ